jgi:hypothetical protein
LKPPEECDESDDCPAALVVVNDDVKVPKAVFKDAVRKFQRMAKLEETGETNSDRTRSDYNRFYPPLQLSPNSLTLPRQATLYLVSLALASPALPTLTLVAAVLAWYVLPTR